MPVTEHEVAIRAELKALGGNSVRAEVEPFVLSVVCATFWIWMLIPSS
jgi:hypothetical protein